MFHIQHTDLHKEIMLFNKVTMALSTLACAGLVGCGGGGGGTTAAVVTTVAFPLKSAFTASTAAGFSKNFTVSGTCSGTASVTRSAAAGGATFEGSAALSAVSTVTSNYSNCTPASSASSSTGYFDSNYVPLGFSSASEYGVFATPPNIPTTVSVGSTALLGSENIYTNSTKSTLSGRSDFSFVVEADTASTAIVNLISKRYNTSNQLLYTEQTRYRIAATGPLTPVSIDIQFATTSTTRLVLQ